jgi:hypothetical protein
VIKFVGKAAEVRVNKVIGNCNPVLSQRLSNSAMRFYFQGSNHKLRCYNFSDGSFRGFANAASHSHPSRLSGLLCLSAHCHRTGLFRRSYLPVSSAGPLCDTPHHCLPLLFLVTYISWEGPQYFLKPKIRRICTPKELVELLTGDLSRR